MGWYFFHSEMQDLRKFDQERLNLYKFKLIHFLQSYSAGGERSGTSRASENEYQRLASTSCSLLLIVMDVGFPPSSHHYYYSMLHFIL